MKAAAVCHCGDSGWYYLGPTRCLDGVVRFLGWAACADCNDDGAKPIPTRPAFTAEALN